ncbi:glycosyltransferase family 4 protein [Roseobacter litoralis]|uniref:Gylcosyl transferase-like protein n=1 Tax=Roseobacter litoralis (strain ATCC 49566 / DSM 6996 / JCM 21268 / NBRC 15278 / OCh 149) TaxID=391595 RepID=F7ZMK6_ROSLO|nr:glycosyltransferase family 4 protein [Roseobacter litoralis]AEI96543.1 gylcosyl transferase-like protein [Roseobacter litoralis Och 149]
MALHSDRHILIVVENLPVPLDRRVWLEATSLQQAGYEVSVICPMGCGWNKTYEVIDGVHIYRHSEPPEAHSGAVAYAREYLHAMWHWFCLARTVWRRKPFQVIQGCNPPDLIFVLALWYRFWGVSYLFDHHDVCPELYEAKFDKQGLLYKIMLICERLTFATASVSMATNGSFRDIAIRRGKMASEDVFVVRSAPKIDTFLPGPGDPVYRKGAKTVMGYVGVIGQQEGMDLLVQAARHLIKDLNHTDVHFVIAGFGPTLDEVVADAEAQGVGDYFTFTGPLYGPDLLDALNVIDIGVSPDPKNPMNDISTMNKTMEYMTLEKPSVQFDLTEGRVSAGEASLYALPNDPVDFANKLAELIADSARGVEMGKKGRARVLDNLSWTHTTPQLLKAYDRIYAKRSKA